MKFNLIKDIINIIDNKKEYVITVNGVEKTLGGSTFKTHILTTYRTMSEDNIKALYESLKVKQEDKQVVEDNPTDEVAEPKTTKRKNGNM